MGFMGKNCEYKRLKSSIFKNSTILTWKQSVQLINLISSNQTKLFNSTWKLIYQASVDGFSSRSFHSKCDGYMGTLVVIKSVYNYIFGGFTSINWSAKYDYKHDSNSFLFNLVNFYNISLKMNIIKEQNPMYAKPPSYGITFGSGIRPDLTCFDNGYCYSNLGFGSYYLSDSLKASIPTRSLLGGSFYFKATEIEVYYKFV